MQTVEQKLLSYQTLFAEGVIFLSRAFHKEAIEVFTKCFILLTDIESPTDVIQTFIIHTLLHRSKSHLEIGGHSQLALADALKAYAMNDKDPFALLAVAEAYYDSGEFEQALIQFHRGLAVKPEWKIFEKGIHKCSSVIESALSRINFEKVSRMNINVESEYKSMSNNKPKKVETSLADYSELEELNLDRLFMIDLLADKVFLAGVGELKVDIEDSVAFLETRVQFWKQKNLHHAMAVIEGPAKRKAKRAKRDDIVKSFETRGNNATQPPSISVNLKMATLIKSKEIGRS